MILLGGFILTGSINNYEKIYPPTRHLLLEHEHEPDNIAEQVSPIETPNNVGADVPAWVDKYRGASCEPPTCAGGNYY